MGQKRLIFEHSHDHFLFQLLTISKQFMIILGDFRLKGDMFFRV